MKIFIKHIIRNIEDKIGRTLLIVFTLFGVGVIVSLVFMSLYGMADLYKLFNNNDVFFDYRVTSYREDFNYESLPNLDIDYLGIRQFEDGYIENGEYNRLMISTLDYDRANKLDLIDNYDKFKLDDNEIMLTKELANILKLKKGEEIVFTSADGTEYNLTFKYISSDNLSKVGNVAFVNENTYKNISKIEDEKYSLFLAKYNGKERIEDFNKKLYSIEDDYGLKFEYLEMDIIDFGSGIIKLIIVVFILGFAIVYFVLNSIVKIIMEERVPVVGSFRSVGASKLKTNIILICEMGIYGLIGGLFGSIIVVGLLGSLFNMIYQIEVVNGIAGSTNAIAAVVVLCTTVAMILFQILISIDEILEFNTMSIKECMFNSKEKKYKRTPIKLFVGFAFLVIGIGGVLVGYRTNYITGVMSLFALFAAISFILPEFTRIIERLVKRRSNPILSMAFNTINNNRLQVNTNIIITILLSISIALLSFLNYQIKVFDKKYDLVKSDVYALVKDEPTGLTNDILLLDNVDNISILEEATLGFENLSIANNKIASLADISLLYSDNIDHLKESTTIGDVDFDKWKNLKGTEAILDDYFRDKYGIKENDTITISFNTEEKHFSFDTNIDVKVIGFTDLDSIVSRAMIVSENYFNMMGTDIYKHIFINVKDKKETKETKDEINKLLVSDSSSVMTKSEYDDSIKSQTSTIRVVIYVCILAIVIIGLIGIINNQTVSFLERSKEMAILYSTCMSRKQLSSMVLKETLLAYVLSSIFSIIFGILLSNLFVYIAEDIGFYFPVSFNLLYTIILLAVLAVTMLVIYISIKRKIKKLDIVEELKYE